jgi:hypothetical protein
VAAPPAEATAPIVAAEPRIVRVRFRPWMLSAIVRLHELNRRSRI